MEQKYKKEKYYTNISVKFFYDFHGRLVGMMGESQSISGGIGGGVRGWIGRYEIKKEQLYIRIALYKKAATYSPTCVVPSALKGLTALFGMVRGETFDYNHLKSF